jgi:hypothetical protein
VVRQAIDDVVALDARLHQLDEGADVAIGEGEADLGGERFELIRRGNGDRHGVSPLSEVSGQGAR